MFLDNILINDKYTKVILFDFDGVILDSVDIKTEAFKRLFSNYPEEIVSKIISHHTENGGMSRFDKICYYFKEYINSPLSNHELELHLKKFSDLTFELVCNCSFKKGALEFITENYNKYDFHIISATPQEELIKIAEYKKITNYFLEILGSPKTKKENIEFVINKYNYKTEEAIFIGDSKNDYDSAIKSRIFYLGIV